MRFTTSAILATLSVVSYATSLALPGFYAGGREAVGPGFFILLGGFFTVASGGFPWLANPLLFATWVLLIAKQSWLALFLALATLAFMVSLLFVGKAPISSEGSPVVVTGYAAGYWLWVVSGLLALTSSVLALGRVSHKESP